MRDEFNVLNEIEMDFDEYGSYELTNIERASIKKNIKKSLNKKRFSYKKCLALASCIAVVAAISQTAFAQNFVDRIIRSISTGHNQFAQMEPRTEKIPDNMKLKFFDKDGNPLTEFKEGETVYDENGNVVMIKVSDSEEEATVTVVDTDGNTREVESMSKDNVIVSDSTKIQQYLNFKSMLPQYIPQGFEFDYAGLYKDENGSVSGDYLMVTYKNAETGERIYLHERIMNDETAFSTGALTLEETTINGNKAVISDNRSIDWEQDNASYGISGRGILNNAELIKMAESMK